MLVQWFFLSLFLFVNQSFALRGMVPIEEGLTEKPDTLIEITNMPRLVNQGATGVCYAATASVLIDQATCKYYDYEDCTQMPEDKRASVMDMTRFLTKDSWHGNPVSRGEYLGLEFDGGSLSQMLFIALYGGGMTAFMQDSCAPFDLLHSQLPDAAEAQQHDLKMWKKFKESYNEFQLKGCTDCAESFAEKMVSDLKAEFDIRFSLERLPLAYQESDYRAFLDVLLIPEECLNMDKTVNIPPDLALESFPYKDEYTNYDELMGVIKVNLRKEVPMGLSFCAAIDFDLENPVGCEQEGHILVIHGYKKVCDSENNCKDALRVQNSYGQVWQDNNNDGWLDAKTLLDRTTYFSVALTWVERIPPPYKNY